MIIGNLRGHATDSPARWKEPRAFAAADHTSQRARQGRGRQGLRRRVQRQCAARGQAAGSLIPHARAIRPLVIAMIEAPFGAPAMSAAGSRDRSAAREAATRRGAVRVPPITRDTHREEPVAEATDFLAKGYVHVGAVAHSDWTRGGNRGTTSCAVSACRSVEAVIEGLEGLSSRPSPHRHAVSLRDVPPRWHEQNKRLWTLTQPWTHRTRPPLLGNLAEEREIPTSVHSPFLFPSEEKNEEHLRRQPSRFTRFQVSADRG